MNEQTKLELIESRKCTNVKVLVKAEPASNTIIKELILFLLFETKKNHEFLFFLFDIIIKK